MDVASESNHSGSMIAAGKRKPAFVAKYGFTYK